MQITKEDYMSLSRKLAAATVSGVAAAIMFAAPVFAAVGQIEGGDIYWAKDVTQNGAFVDPTSAKAGDTLIYRVRIHNPGEACLSNVQVKAILPSAAGTSNKSTITVWADAATTNFISDTATVNLSDNQTISYVSGTTQLLDNNGVLSTLPETIFTSGVNIGGVCVSTNNERFVQFQAKVNTPTPVTPVTPTTTTTTTTHPTTLPNTGAGDVLGIFAGASAAGTAAHAVIARRRR
jgi:uncharacterized repeat protein (TIGR01451 family)